MKAVLHIVSGRLAGRRVRLRQGTPLRVGHGARADVAVTHDDKMAAVHFELFWDGSVCRLRDIGKLGTTVDGKAVSEAAVRDGAMLVAGHTGFLVRVLPADLAARLPPPPAWWAPPTAEQRAARSAALATLAAEKGLHAILDGARDRRIKALIDACDDESRSLFDGEKGDHLSDVAPYLVKLEPSSELLAFFVSQAWGDSWGVCLTSRRPLDEIRQRLRRSLMVVDEATTKRMFFRFYDPRVLRLFWPESNARQRSEVIGTEIERFLVEGPSGEVLRFEKDG